MTLKFLAIGDPHFKINNIEHSTEFTIAVLNFLRKTPDLDFVVILGDVHDRHQYIHSEILTNVSKFFTEISLLFPLYVLVGNHDRRNNSDFLSEVHPFVDMINKPNIYIAHKVLDLTIKNHRVLFVPYVPNGRFMEALNTVENPLTAEIILAHQEFKGVPMGAIISEHGDEWDYFKPWVITGHIHDYWRNNRNIIYVGTPMQHAFGDKHDKTVSLFTLYEDKIDEYLAKLDEERINLGLKTREIVRIPFNKISIFKPNPLKYQKLVVIGTEGEIKALKMMPYFKELCNSVVKVDFDYIDENINAEELVNDDMDSLKKDTNSYLKYLQDRISHDVRKSRIFQEIFS